MINSPNHPISLNPFGWAPARGYSNGISVKGRHVFLAGQIGWNPATCEFESDSLVDQTRQTLFNIAALLDEAGASPEHLVRMTWFMTDKKQYMALQREIGQVYREILGKNFPAMSVVFVSQLVEDRALIEIEATAVIPE